MHVIISFAQTGIILEKEKNWMHAHGSCPSDHIITRAQQVSDTRQIMTADSQYICGVHKLNDHE